MDWKPEEENVIRRYLLDDATPEERRRVEKRLLEDDDYGELLLLIEGELIDDYAGGAMSQQEQSLFRRNFLLTPYRRENLVMARGVVKYAGGEAAGDGLMPEGEMNIEERQTGGAARRKRDIERGRDWRRMLFLPEWKIAAYAVLVLAAGVGYWLLRPNESEVTAALASMNRAFSEQRPLETRITGFNYAPFPKLLGGEQDKVDYVAVERAERILLDAERQGPDVAAQHALGRLYLAQKKIDQAQNMLNAALRLDPDNARIHSDLGAALFEKWARERPDGQSTAGEELKRQSLEHLTKALALDGALREARFNRALLYQTSNQPQLANEEWQKYLASDPDSPWAEEARSNLKRLQE